MGLRDTFLEGWDDMAAVYIADTQHLVDTQEAAVAEAVVDPRDTQTAFQQDALSACKPDS